MDKNQHNVKWAKLWAAVWSDESLKERLKSDPHKVLAEFDIQVPENLKINVLENTTDTMNLIIPNKPADGNLSIEDLEKVVGGEGCALGCVHFACVH